MQPATALPFFGQVPQSGYDGNQQPFGLAPAAAASYFSPATASGFSGATAPNPFPPMPPAAGFPGADGTTYFSTPLVRTAPEVLGGQQQQQQPQGAQQPYLDPSFLETIAAIAREAIKAHKDVDEANASNQGKSSTSAKGSSSRRRSSRRNGSDENDSDVSDEELGESKPRPVRIKNLPSQTVASLRAHGTLEPSTVPHFLRLFELRCQTHDTRTVPIFDATVEVLTIEQQEVDRWLAGTLSDCLDHASAHVSNLLRATDDATLRSGRALIAACSNTCNLSLGAERQAAEIEFAKLRPFRIGMAQVDVDKHANLLVEKFQRLPKFSKSDPLCMRQMLLEKLPDAPPDFARKKRDLIEELYTAEAMSTTFDAKLSSPWTFTALIKIIGIKLRSVVEPAARIAEQQPQQRRQQQQQQPRQQQQQRRQQPFGGGVCPNCGENGHSSRDCTKVCAQCGVKNCPGAYGGACVITPAERPRNVKNARGTQVHDNVYKAIVAEWQRRHPNARAAEAGDDDTFEAGPVAASAAVAADAGPSLHAHVVDLETFLLTSRLHWWRQRSSGTSCLGRNLPVEQ